MKKTKNSIQVIHPYKKGHAWVFDDPAVGLKEEPFVAGIPEIIEITLGEHKFKKTQFTLTFAGKPFPGWKYKIVWVSGDTKNKKLEGNVYRLDGTSLEGWLCPALFKYFKVAPKEIYIQIQGEPLDRGNGKIGTGIWGA